MYFAIDDTYGPANPTTSKYVTGDRRTHVGVIFKDDEVDHIREQIRACLDYVSKLAGENIAEFHFVDLYNRKTPWDKLAPEFTLTIFGAFCEIYRAYRWPVIVSTIDERTFADHKIGKLEIKVDGLDLRKREDLSLMFLCSKLKSQHKGCAEPLFLYLDEGRKKPGNQFGTEIFKNWEGPYSGQYESSSKEPLLQMADLLAFCVNRSTHLEMKEKRTQVDTWVLGMVAEMRINSPDIILESLPDGFSAEDFDEILRVDRIWKKLEEK